MEAFFMSSAVQRRRTILMLMTTLNAYVTGHVTSHYWIGNEWVNFQWLDIELLAVLLQIRGDWHAITRSSLLMTT